MDQQEAPGLDSFSKRYLAVLGVAGLVAVLWWWIGQDDRVGELNRLLQADAELSVYPYEFRVLSLENGVASMSSPRSARVSAIQGLRIMFPALEQESAISDPMMAAQQQLAAIQSRAAGIVTAEPDVSSVRWVLDERWLTSHGVYID